MHALFLIKIYNFDNNFFYHILEIIYIINHLIIRHYMILLFLHFSQIHQFLLNLIYFEI